MSNFQHQPTNPGAYQIHEAPTQAYPQTLPPGYPEALPQGHPQMPPQGYSPHPQMLPYEEKQAVPQPTHHAQHPAQQSGAQKWKHGMCGCFSDGGVCCTGYWCPCILYGKTKYRIRNPTMGGYSCCNGSCMGYAVLATCLAPFYVILSMNQRSEIRRKYNLPGSGCGDYCRALCCSCCSLIQEEMEVIDQKKKENQGYQAPGGMVYGP